MIGETVGKYRVLHELGRGGMGVVYAAEHTTLGSKVAVKMLLPEVSANRTTLGRFFNEARAASKIKHAGIVTVFDYGEHTSGSAYLVMELLEGQTLAARRKQSPPLGVRGALLVARQTARALAAAHAEGIVHRDLKPHNLFLVPDPDLPGGTRVKILDFGIAKLTDERSGGLTGEQSVIGTPRYMSPEQCRGAARVDQRADVYALGCILYELLAGVPPFQAEGAGELIAKHIFEPAPALGTRVAGVDPALEAFVSRCLAKEPDERPASMREVAEALDRLLERAPDEPLTPTVPPRVVPEAGGTATSGEASTLGHSAAEVAPRRARSSSRWLVVGGVVLAGGVAAALWPAPDEPPPVVTAPPPAPIDAAVAVPPARRDTVTVEVTSEPSGAVILRAADEAFFGQTPLRRVVPFVDGQIDLVVRKKGYAPRAVVLRTDEDGTAHVVLEAEKRGKPAKPAAPVVSTPTPPAADTPIGDGYLDPFAGRAGDAGPR